MADVIIIYSHPNHEGHSGYFLKRCITYLKKKNISLEIWDLYKMNFNPLLTDEEIYTKKDFKIAPDVEKLQTKIKECNKLIFIYPTWWQNVPAVLKGFIDKVFTPGFAYEFKGKIPKGLLVNKKAIIFTTAGGPRLISRFVYGDLALKVIINSVLKFCNIKAKAFPVGKATRFNEETMNEIKKQILKGMKYLFK